MIITGDQAIDFRNYVAQGRWNSSYNTSDCVNAFYEEYPQYKPATKFKSEPIEGEKLYRVVKASDRKPPLLKWVNLLYDGNPMSGVWDGDRFIIDGTDYTQVISCISWLEPIDDNGAGGTNAASKPLTKSDGSFDYDETIANTSPSQSKDKNVSVVELVEEAKQEGKKRFKKADNQFLEVIQQQNRHIWNQALDYLSQLIQSDKGK